jgi:hypothetical protein
MNGSSSEGRYTLRFFVLVAITPTLEWAKALNRFPLRSRAAYISIEAAPHNRRMTVDSNLKIR